MKNFIILSVIAFCVLALVLSKDEIARSTLPLIIGKSEDRAIAQFINECQNAASLGIAEDMLADSLIISGWRVAPRVVKEIANPSMPCRRYAIGFLGNIKFQPGASRLLEILSDNSEQDYFRADALVAIFHIDPKQGRNLANQFKESSPFLGQVANDIISNKSWFTEDRTYWKAVLRAHD